MENQGVDLGDLEIWDYWTSAKLYACGIAHSPMNMKLQTMLSMYTMQVNTPLKYSHSACVERKGPHELYLFYKFHIDLLKYWPTRTIITPEFIEE